jgi:fructokinase
LRLLSIGEILWDVIGGEEYLGGAPFNLAAHSVRLGHHASLLSAVGNDDRGHRAIAVAQRLGVETGYVSVTHQADTGVAIVLSGQAVNADWKIVRPGAYDFLMPSDQLLADSFDAICYGTLLQTFEPAHRATERVLETFPDSIHFYDVNLRPRQYDLKLVERLMSAASVVKLNDSEAEVISGQTVRSLRDFCESQARQFSLQAIAVTRGDKGCAVFSGDQYAEAPAIPVKVADIVGAGDAFSAAFLHGVVSNWSAARIAEFANRVGALVAGRPGAVPDWTFEELEQPLA